MVAVALGAIIVFSVVGGLWCGQGTAPGRPVLPGLSLLPLAWWLLAVSLVYANQVLFTVYVLRVHHGDPSFVARYLPSGWFVLANRNARINWLAARWPAPELLAVCVLRVQAFLELPFVLFGFLTVCRWFNRQAYRRAAQLVPMAAASYTATFCLIEWHLRNPYTTDDLIIRVASAVVIPLVASRFSEPGADPVRSAGGLLVFALSTAAFGYLILAVYDTALLYNLGHLGRSWPGMAAAGLVLAGSRRIAARSPGSAGPRVGLVIASSGWFLVLFFTPALAIRYGLSSGARPVAALALLIVAALAVVRGHALRPAMALAAGAGVVVAVLAYVVAGGYPEARLLAAALAFLTTATAICALLDHHTTRPT
jgi:hypothetical protein